MEQTSINDQKYIHLNIQTLQRENIQSEHIILHFGALTKELLIKIDNQIEPGKVSFPYKLTNHITMPDLPYDYYFKGNHLFVGPVIGMLVLPLYYKDPSKQLLRFSKYNEIKGLVFLFKARSLNKITRTIEGYYYNPKTGGFVQGIFPYPSVIFNRVRMKANTYQHLHKYIGDNIFNYPYGNANKWVFWEQLSKNPMIKRHLPYTIQYSEMNLRKMLHRYNEVYLKPTSLAGGRGVLHIKKSSIEYTITNKDGDTRKIKSRIRLFNKVKKSLHANKAYIIQQAIPFYNGAHKVDFRVYFQKDQTKNWKYSGMETKVAKKGSIISNSINRKKIMSGESALRRLYGLDDHQVQKKVKEISRIGIKALQVLNKLGGHIGDAAVDMIIDNHNHVWLLEAQFNYAAEIKMNRKGDERRILPQILPTPFEYAKALTGF